jgi:hypothetical protein
MNCYKNCREKKKFQFLHTMFKLPAKSVGPSIKFTLLPDYIKYHVFKYSRSPVENILAERRYDSFV